MMDAVKGYVRLRLASASLEKEYVANNFRNRLVLNRVGIVACFLICLAEVFSSYYGSTPEDMMSADLLLTLIGSSGLLVCLVGTTLPGYANLPVVWAQRWQLYLCCVSGLCIAAKFAIQDISELTAMSLFMFQILLSERLVAAPVNENFPFFVIVSITGAVKCAMFIGKIYNTFLLFTFTIVSAYPWVGVLYTRAELYVDRLVFQKARQLSDEEKVTERILRSSIPRVLRSRVSDGNVVLDKYEHVTLFVSDIEKFTYLCSKLSPQQLVVSLEEVFSSMESLAEQHGLLNIKTIGDAFVCAGGLFGQSKDQGARAVVDFALDVLALCERCTLGGNTFRCRIGVATGPVVGGILEGDRSAFDLWGPAVTDAGLLEVNGVPGKVLVSRATRDILENEKDFSDLEINGNPAFLLIHEVADTLAPEGVRSLVSMAPVHPPLSASMECMGAARVPPPSVPEAASLLRSLANIREEDSHWERAYGKEFDQWFSSSFVMLVKLGAALLFVATILFSVVDALLILEPLGPSFLLTFVLPYRICLLLILLPCFFSFNTKTAMLLNFFFLPVQVLLGIICIMLPPGRERRLYLLLVFFFVLAGNFFIHPSRLLRYLITIPMSIVNAAVAVTVVREADADVKIHIAAYCTTWGVMSLVVVGVVVHSQTMLLRHAFLFDRKCADQTKLNTSLMSKVLPQHIAHRLLVVLRTAENSDNDYRVIQGGTASDENHLVDSFDHCSIMFCSAANFLEVTKGMDPARAVALLNSMFKVLDGLIMEHNVEKVKMIDQIYMCVAGAPRPTKKHANDMAAFCLKSYKALCLWADEQKLAFTFKMGCHSGSVVAGVIGRERFIWDLFGDSVNVASRMMSTAPPESIQVSSTFAALIKDLRLSSRGFIDVKGKDQMETYFLDLT